MSSYLGVQPTDRPDYFFASYCNEDASRLTPLIKQLTHYNIPIWYDYGLTYGSQWQTQIADRIQGCQALLLFVTKRLFEKPNSYVTTEYEMATDYFDKTVYTVHLDDIEKDNIPNSYLGWWISVKQRQSLVVSEYKDRHRLMEEFSRMLKVGSPEERVTTAMAQYQVLQRSNRGDEAERLFASVLHEQLLKSKAELLLKLLSEGYAGLKASDHAASEEAAFNRHTFLLGDHSFKASSRTVFHRVGAGDADVIDVFRDDELLFTIFGLVDAYDGVFLYDEGDDLLFILYSSYPNVPSIHEASDHCLMSVCVVERPCADAVCRDYRHPILVKYKN